MPSVYSLALFLAILLISTIYVAARGSLEAGEERFWLLDVFALASLLLLAVVAFSPTISGFLKKAAAGVILLSILLIAIAASINVADTLNSRPERHPGLASALFGLERYYISVFGADERQVQRNKEKLEFLRAIDS